MMLVSQELVRGFMADHYGATDVKDVSNVDLLGYDIECNINGVTHHIEVKSTKTNTENFVLTQSEVEALNEYEDTLWVVFVSNVLEDQPGPRRVEVIRGLHDHAELFTEVQKPPDYRVQRPMWDSCVVEVLEI